MRASVLAIAVAAAASTAALPHARGSGERAVETRVVAPLADPSIAPGVARCTSDGACTVTDERGTRRAATVVTPGR